MRPDEHKRKKNTQYKKKHGISEDKKPEVKTKSTIHEKKDNIQNDQPKVVTESKDKVKEDNPEADTCSKHFGRRKIVSNWSRYENSTDSEGEDDIPLQRGEDFNKLLAEAGGSATQFRFKDEEWTEESQSTTTPALALDFENLSELLSCIPLHERLGICESVFSEEQNAEMKAHSAEAQRKHQTALDSDDMTPVSVNTIADGFGRSEKTIPLPLNPVNKSFSSAKENCDAKNSSGTAIQSSAVTKDKQTKNENYVHVKSDDGKTLNNCKSKEVEKLEDDLDMILSFDECIGKKVEPENNVKRDSKVITEKTDRIEKKTADRTKEGVANGKGDENLEDWLDSMLDD